MDDICKMCEGDGRVANTPNPEPWPAWERLPEASKAAVQMGLVKPIPCPDCGGSGKKKGV